MLPTFLVGKFAFRVSGPVANRATSQTIGFCLQRLHLISALIQGEMGADNLAFTFALSTAFAFATFGLAKRGVGCKLELDRVSTLGFLGIKLLEAVKG